MTLLVRHQRKVLLFLILAATVVLGFAVSWKNIPNQEGYFEGAWRLSHIDFSNTLLSPAVTPLIFITGMLIEQTLGISVVNAWKLMDLIFAGASASFLTWVYWKVHKPTTVLGLLMPTLVIISSVGFIYSFTSGSGEGMPIFFALVGVYLWHQRRFQRASLFFILSFLSKFTVYLIGPGVALWTLLQLRKFSKKELKHIAIAAIMFLSVFLLYHTIKQWGDFKLQTPYIANFSLSGTLGNFPPFLVALLLGAPIVALFAALRPDPTNLYWLAGVSSLAMLLRRYFYWNHPQQIIVFWMLYFVTHPKARMFLQKRFVVLQVIFSWSLISLLPLNLGEYQIFYRHMTQAESLAIDQEIMKDYRGGKIGYYLNRRFDEPFPNYEISYMEPDWDFVVEDTEYIVVPAGSLPQQVARHTHCRFTYHAQIARNFLYRVQCNNK